RSALALAEEIDRAFGAGSIAWHRSGRVGGGAHALRRLDAPARGSRPLETGRGLGEHGRTQHEGQTERQRAHREIIVWRPAAARLPHQAARSQATPATISAMAAARDALRVSSR